MRKALSGILLGILSFMFIVLTTGTSNADVATDNAKVVVNRVHYNSKGNDLDSNAWQEGVLVKNTGAAVVDLNNWRVHDTYRSNVNKSVAPYTDNYTNSCVISGISLAQDETVYVTSSSVAYAVYAARIDATKYFYCDFAGKGKGYNGGIYNNMGDTVYLEYWNGTRAVRTSVKSYGFENGYYVN